MGAVKKEIEAENEYTKQHFTKNRLKKYFIYHLLSVHIV